MLPSFQEVKQHLETTIYSQCENCLHDNTSTHLDGHVCITLDDSQIVWFRLGASYESVDISSYSTFKEGKTEVDLLKQSIINAVMSVCRIGLQYHTSIQVDVFLALILNQQSLVLVSFGEMYECKSAKSLSGETSLETNESAFPFSLRQIPPEESQSKNNSPCIAPLTITLNKSECIFPKRRGKGTRQLYEESNSSINSNRINEQDIDIVEVSVKQEPELTIDDENLELVTAGQKPNDGLEYEESDCESEQYNDNVDSGEESFKMKVLDHGETEVDEYDRGESEADEDIGEFKLETQKKKSKRKSHTPQKVKKKQLREEVGPQDKDEEDVEQVNKKVTCYTCKKTFPKDCVKQHFREHRVECLDCGATFCNKKSLERHSVQSHGDEAGKTCHICGKHFSSVYYFKLHVMAHNGQYRFTCSFCGKGVDTSYNLKRHMAMEHDGPKSKCEKCDKEFTDPSNKTKHEQVCGTTERAHKCKLCPKIFKAKRYLQAHVKDKHVCPTVLMCEVCGHKCETRAGLRAHRIKKHSEKF